VTKLPTDAELPPEIKQTPRQFRHLQIFWWIYTLIWIATFVWLVVTGISTWWRVIILVVLVFGQPALAGLFWSYRDYLVDFRRRGNPD
jgi:predicted cobalt transporter CbtA